MQNQIKAKIFPGTERGIVACDWYCSWQTFNFAEYQDKNKTPFESLYILNEDVLAGKKSLELTVNDNSYIIILPISGVLNYKVTGEEEYLVSPGEAFVHIASKGTVVEFANPNNADPVNFLHLWVRNISDASEAKKISGFYMKANKNKLIELFKSINSSSDFSPNCYIGSFTNRQDIIYKQEGKNHGVFCFVINGIFEIQGRLLESKDGLALWSTHEFEIESFADNSLLVVLEVPHMEYPGKTE